MELHAQRTRLWRRYRELPPLRVLPRRPEAKARSTECPVQSSLTSKVNQVYDSPCDEAPPAHTSAVHTWSIHTSLMKLTKGEVYVEMP